MLNSVVGLLEMSSNSRRDAAAGSGRLHPTLAPPLLDSFSMMGGDGQTLACSSKPEHSETASAATSCFSHHQQEVEDSAAAMCRDVAGQKWAVLKRVLCVPRSEERLGHLLGGRSQRRLRGPAIGRGPRVAAGRRERPHLPAESRRREPAHQKGETGNRAVPVRFQNKRLPSANSRCLIGCVSDLLACS